MSNKDYFVVLMISRHKDNKNVEGFKTRVKSFLSEFNKEQIEKEFDLFVRDGVPNETSRLYISVNKRNLVEINKQLIHYLIDHPDCDTSKSNLSSIVAGIASRKECALEHKWIFDFDCDDKTKVNEFSKDIHEYSGLFSRIVPTPHGFAVVVDQGFDTRALMEKWKDVDIALKRDDKLFYAIKKFE